MHRRDEVSNAPSRRSVQSTAKISSHSETTEIEYIWSVQMTAATSWTSATKKHEVSVGSDNPNDLGRINISKHPDYPMQ